MPPKEGRLRNFEHSKVRQGPSQHIRLYMNVVDVEITETTVRNEMLIIFGLRICGTVNYDLHFSVGGIDILVSE